MEKPKMTTNENRAREWYMTREQPASDVDDNCYYCGQRVQSLSADIGLWPILLSHPDEPGVIKTHHRKCVEERLHPAHAVQLWVAADEDGTVNIHDGEKPYKHKSIPGRWVSPSSYGEWDKFLLGPAPKITWRDEPRRVMVSVRIEAEEKEDGNQA